MKATEIYQYVYFGTALMFLREVEAGSQIHGDGFVLFNLEVFLDGLDEFNLPVTSNSGTCDAAP